MEPNANILLSLSWVAIVVERAVPYSFPRKVGQLNERGFECLNPVSTSLPITKPLTYATPAAFVLAIPQYITTYTRCRLTEVVPHRCTLALRLPAISIRCYLTIESIL